MKRKVSSAIALGIAIANITPIIVHAETSTYANTNQSNAETKLRKDFTNSDVLKKYPKIKIISEDKLVKKEFSKEIYNSLDDVILKLNNAINNKSVDELKKVINEVLDIHFKTEYDDILLHDENDQFDYIIFNSIGLIFELTENNKALRNTLLSDLTDNMYLASAKKINTLQYGAFLSRYSQYLHTTVSNYVEDDRTKEIILFGFCMINQVENYNGKPLPPIDNDLISPGRPSFPENEKPSTVDPELIPDPPEIPPEQEIPPIIPPLRDPEGEGDYINPSEGYEDFEYVNKNGICYKVTKVYNGKSELVKTYEEKLSNGLSGFCNIYDYEIIDKDVWNETHQSDISLEVWNSLAENDLNQLSTKTIQFTINKSSNKPYYYDTLIKASSNDTVTFTQLKDTLLQVISKTKAYLLEDKDKLMFIAEGKPMIILDKNKEFTPNEVLAVLKDFKDIGLKVDEKKSLDGYSLEDKLKDNELNTIKFKGESIVLNKSPQINEGILQLPVVQIAELIGYDVEDNSDKLILTAKKNNKDIKIEIFKNSKDIIINGVTKKTSTFSQVLDNTYFGEMNLIIKEIGYTMLFDADRGIIEIKE